MFLLQFLDLFWEKDYFFLKTSINHLLKNYPKYILQNLYPPNNYYFLQTHLLYCTLLHQKLLSFALFCYLIQLGKYFCTFFYLNLMPTSIRMHLHQLLLYQRFFILFYSKNIFTIFIFVEQIISICF